MIFSWTVEWSIGTGLICEFQSCVSGSNLLQRPLKNYISRQPLKDDIGICNDPFNRYP